MSYSVVWFKRDLRITDHAPLCAAQTAGIPFLLLYCFEPSVMRYEDADVRHWRFVYESLKDLQNNLNKVSAQLYVFHQEAIAVLSQSDRMAIEHHPP